MQFNIIYTNNGPRTPTGRTGNQTVASLSEIGVYLDSVTYSKTVAPEGNTAAASVIQSNGESIGNARLKSNPLPPGITS